MKKKTKGIIAAGNPLTAEAGQQMFELGGNAFDAAVAAKLARMAAEPVMDSPGGGGFMTAYTQEGKALFYDFFIQTPHTKRPPEELDFYPVYIDYGIVKEAFHIGRGSMGVPGAIAGIFKIYENLCTLPFHELAAPAIKIAREGAILDDFQPFTNARLEGILQAQPDVEAIYYKNGKLLEEGEKLFLPGFADMLEALVKEGRDFFYKGEIARKLTEACAEGGGMLSMEDFSKFEVIHRNPLNFTYRNKRILTNPLPSLGGSLIGLGLKELEKRTIDFAAVSEEHLLAIYEVIVKMDEWHKHPGDLAENLRAAGVQPHGHSIYGNTTHFGVMDELGNVVGMTSSIGPGAAVLVPGTECMMNNMLGESALLPHGFHSWVENTRLPSMMSPTVVIDENQQPLAVLGTGGAGRIPSVIMQVLHYLIDHNMDVETAVRSPRLHFHNGVFNVEKGFPDQLPDVEGLKELVRWENQDMYFGGVHTILKKRGEITALGDPRRSGVVRKAE